MSGHIVVPIQFKKVGKKYHFSTNNIDLAIDDFVVVETARGLELGRVADSIKEISTSEVVSELKPILRKASDYDLKKYEDNKILAADNFILCKKLILEHKLEMKLLSAEFTLDKKKIVFYYTSDERVDFRELVRDLASRIKTRIELRQVGERDGAKALGGIGFCGRELCCSTHLCQFDTISIKMAKNQKLSLNPTKITGVCGKLLCCIKFENENYTRLKVGLPKVGSMVDTPTCKGCKVVDIDILRQMVKVSEQGKYVTYPLEEIDDGSNK